MIPSGKLITAARAILGWTQADLAKATNLHPNAIKYWEHHEVITSRHQTWNSAPEKIEKALCRHGVVFIDSPGPGVCLCAPETISRTIRAGVHARHGIPQAADI